MKKRVLFFCNGLYGGGAEKVLQVVLKHLSPNKYDITLYSLRKEEKRDVYPFNRIKYRYIYNQYAESDSFLKRISIKLINKIKLWIYYHLSPSVFYRLFVRGVYDVEVAFIEGEATRIISGSTNKKSRKLAWVHIDLESNHWTKCSYRKDEEARSYGRYDKILGVSDTVCAAFQREFPSVSVPVETMYNAVDTEDILSKAQESVDTEHERIRLVTVGRLEAQKGYARLLRIVNKLVEEGGDIELWILGEGSERGVLEQYMMEHRLQERVFLLGFQPNPYKYLVQGDLFVCSSLAEGYSTAVTEALVLGLPVVTTACSGMEELLQGGEYGVITENSEESLYEGLKKVLSDVEKLSYYRCKAQERGTNLFGTSNPAERLERLLD